MFKHQFVEIKILIDDDNPAIGRHEEHCIKCGACRRVCENDIAVGKMYNLESMGA